MTGDINPIIKCIKYIKYIISTPLTNISLRYRTTSLKIDKITQVWQ